MPRRRSSHDWHGCGQCTISAATFPRNWPPPTCCHAWTHRNVGAECSGKPAVTTCAELSRHLPDWQAAAVRGGQTLWVALPRGDGTSFVQTALRHGVAVLPGTGLDADGHSEQYVRLHFLAPPDELSKAVRRLAAAWRGYDAPTKRVTVIPTMAIGLLGRCFHATKPRGRAASSSQRTAPNIGWPTER